MIELKSNVRDVIARLEWLQQEVPNLLVRALSPKHWLAALRQSAEATLLSLAEPDERALVSSFVETVVASATKEGADYSMIRPDPRRGRVIREAQAIAEKYRQRKYTRYGMIPDLMETRTLDEARELVARWVSEEKDKTDEDMYYESVPGKYHNELVERIWWIFGLHPDEKASDMTTKMEWAASKLFYGGIEPWLAETNSGLTAELANDWLRMVLAAWKSLFQDRLPEVLRMELSELRKGSKT